MFKRASWGTILMLCLSGCANLAYYAQAVGGHLQIMQAARPISQILDDPTTDSGLRIKLEQVAAIREFATRELALPDNGSYRRYADLDRPYVVWNVFAAPEFSVDLKSWCLPLIGCVNYRGYYHQEAAEKFAQSLRRQGLETYVAGVPAYSTLGYFDDPVLNTFLYFDQQEVARLIFHELAHQLLFISGDSAFNESFATTVENEGMYRWLGETASPEARQNFETRQIRKAQFQSLVSDYRQRLKELYTLPQSAQAMRSTKTRIFADLKRAYAEMKATWGGNSAYDIFFAPNLNNARLGSISLYTRLTPAFETLLAEANYDLPAFYHKAKALAQLNAKERHTALERLLGSDNLSKG